MSSSSCPAPPLPPAAARRRAFFALWTAQFLSLVASDVTQFALRLALFERTGSVTAFALFSFWSEFPARLLSPLAGAAADRFDRKALLLASDAASAACNLLLYAGVSGDGGGAGGVPLPLLYAAAAAGSVANAFQWPAFVSSVGLLARRSSGDLVRFGAWQEAAPALSMLLSPLLAGWMVARDPSLRLVFALEFGSFAAAVLVTSLADVPRLSEADRDAEAAGRATPRALAADAARAARWVAARPGLAALVALKAFGMFCSGAVQVVMTPVVLRFGSPQALGTVLTVSGLGAVLGIAAAPLAGRVRRRAVALLVAAAAQGLLIAAAGAASSLRGVLAVAFGFTAFLPTVRALRQAVLQAKTPPGMHGRVFGLQRSLAGLASPAAAAVVGPLVDRVLEPALQPGGALDGTPVAALVGVGPGRGAAACFVAVGLLQVAVAAAGLAYAPLRCADTAYPDRAPAAPGGGETKKEA